MCWKSNLALLVVLLGMILAYWRLRRRSSHMMLPEWCARLRSLPDPLAAPAKRPAVPLQKISDIVGSGNRV